jgi:acetate---CoA ligase (ADP-forming)
MRELTGSEADVAALLHPRSVAVVGASSREGALSWWPLHLLAANGFGGAIYPINPNRSEIDGVRCYPSLSEVGEPVDVAIVALDPERSLQAVQECADRGVRAVVLPTHGFGESGDVGRARQRRLTAAVDGRLRVVGPNTDGVANLQSGAIASIQPLFGQGISSGPVAIATQSGATAGSLMVRLKREGIGCRFYASAGNESDLGLADFMSVMVQDPEVRLVLSFVESIRRPRDFLAVAALAAELGKPIALIKVGRTAAGARRAAAHTGALAGADDLYDAIFREYGVIRVSELAELVAVTKFFLANGAPMRSGVAVMSVSGGQAGAVADQLTRSGVSVPAVAATTEARLDEALELGGGFNPCDLTGMVATDHELAMRVYRAFASDDGIGTVVYARKALTGRAGVAAAANLAAEVCSGDRETRAPAVVYAMDGEVVGEEAEIYAAAGIPVFASVAELGAAIATLVGWCERREHVRAPTGVPPTGAAPTDAAPAGALAPATAGGAALPSGTARELLQRYGLPLAAEAIVGDPEAAVAAAERIGYPVAVKVHSERILHKTEAGGVRLGCRDADAVRRAFAEVRAAAVTALGGAEPAGVLVQEQVPQGVELIAGATVDEGLGPFVLLGIGGVTAELWSDVALRPAPVTPDEVGRMLGELRGAALLRGFRGAPSADVEALADAVARFSRLIADHASVLAEADLNPIIVLPAGHGVRIVDSLLVGR